MSDVIIFEPKNELERQLAAAQAGEVSPETFLDTLMTSEVFMPVRDDDRIKGFQRSTRALPLSVSDDDGTPVLILFSSPERQRVRQGISWLRGRPADRVHLGPGKDGRGVCHCPQSRLRGRVRHAGNAGGGDGRARRYNCG